jgi:hypothetical protein
VLKPFTLPPVPVNMPLFAIKVFAASGKNFEILPNLGWFLKSFVLYLSKRKERGS